MESTITTMLSNCIGKKMRKLVLADCENVSDETILAIGEMCPLLNYLDLSWCDSSMPFHRIFVTNIHSDGQCIYIYGPTST